MWQDAPFLNIMASCPLWIWAVFKVSARAVPGVLITLRQEGIEKLAIAKEYYDSRNLNSFMTWSHVTIRPTYFAG